MLFLIANNLKGWSLQKIVRKTLPLYALGMRLRVFPQSTLLAILSGRFSGLGASLTLLVIRTWLYALSDRDPTEKEQLISARYTLGATVLSGGAGRCCDFGLTVFMTTLVTSAFSLITLGADFFYQSPRSTKHAARNFCLNQSVLLVGFLSYLLFFPNKFGALLVFTVGSFTLAGFYILRELMEYAMFPKNETLIYLGLVQSAFLVVRLEQVYIRHMG